ncbi:LysM peptidoglycan-binding domain-containing protein [Liquorilactobacillus vini]|uniref:Peptidoglycan binding protein n=1 Tax=Liquorilactobacillus vini DSM 20605 TaxID=1133569 RepID=A0A0R2C9H7_9LACO|nr:LysM peptidoglycan-binding domain-containing protein [Liquorilactobacillus vini]KRM88465.1 peptidoglycan binding protein [Liquorilactobacillus vini DSM 20605]
MDIKKILLSAATVTGIMTAGTVAANADTVSVKAGDTVSELAHEYGTTVSDIQTENNLSNVNMIYVGQQLNVNGTNSATTQTTSSNSTANSSTTTSSNTTTTQSQSTTPATNNTVTASTTNSSVSTVANTSASENAAKAWIAARESGGSYTAQNGNYYGKYQLSKSYLNGDYSAANQERVATQYVTSRYGSWQGAVNHWKTYGWY